MLTSKLTNNQKTGVLHNSLLNVDINYSHVIYTVIKIYYTRLTYAFAISQAQVNAIPA